MADDILARLTSENEVGEAALICIAYLGNPATQVTPAKVADVVTAIYGAVPGSPVLAPPAPEHHPAVPIGRSVFPDHIVCLEDGKKLVMLKRYLQTQFGMTPEAYREKWGLPADYPMVAPSYSQKRSGMAKRQGLGRKT